MADSGDYLEVRLHGSLAGRLRWTPERMVFEYDDAYLDRPGSMALSAQLPLVAGPAPQSKAARWFDGLLPEGWRREKIADQLGVPAASTYALLEKVGKECAGAVEVLRPGGGPGKPGLQRATNEEIREHVDRMDQYPLGQDATQRLSIAGMQGKLLLVRRSGMWFWPTGGQASTHILKPESERLPGIAWNEHTCMTLAARAGMKAAATWIEVFGKHKVLVVERYDRTPSGERIHQEDFTQALGSNAKYEGDGGPSLEACVRQAGVAGWDVWEQAMYAWMVGDHDKHAKNYSILYRRGRQAELAPLYDSICTKAYGKDKAGDRMAMKVGKKGDDAWVQEPQVRREAAKCGLDPDEAIRRTHDLAGRVRRGLEGMEDEGWDVGFLVKAGIDERLCRACEWAASA